MIQVNIHEAKTHFSKLVNKAIAGEVIIIAKDNKPVAKLVQITTVKCKRKIGSAKGKINISSDFDQIPEEFKEYIS
jgi:prevent-host-death family protein